jgi:hypothetical protein
MPLVGCWIMCMRCAHYILSFVFCGPGQRSGYSNYLWAGPAQGCSIYRPPLSSVEGRESVELYLYPPCRPWMPVVGWNIFFTFNFFTCLAAGQYSAILLAGWSWVQILIGTKHFSLLQNIQTSSRAHPAFYIRVPVFFPGIKAAITWS